MRLPGVDLTVSAVMHLNSHVDLLAAAGCMPVFLPLLPGIEQFVSRLDGLLLPGGPDLDPALYGAVTHPMTRGVSLDLDVAELALVKAALSAGVPFLGVCRGMQMLNVCFGGTLHQHLPEIVHHDGHLPEADEFTLGKQRLDMKRGSWIAGALGDPATEAACHHHQAIDKVGTGLVATAWASDGIIEVIEAVDHPFAVGVQWEADQTGDARLYEAFVEVASR
jgi:putative glutamine amidotransferase